jgi:hypothetical protein
MNKGSRNIVIGIIVIVVIAVIIWLVGKGGSSSGVSNTTPNPLDAVTGTTTAPLPVSETTKVSGSLSKYENAELGFGVQYPSTWEKGELANGVQFVIPVDASQVSTVNRLEADVNVSSGKCAFPPVTTVESRGTLTLQGITANMITLSNNVQGRSYWNRMVSLEKGGVCYFFAFSYVALSPESKNLTGSNLTQAKNNNNAIKLTGDAAFMNMVKSFVFVAPPAGQDETKAAPVKK